MEMFYEDRNLVRSQCLRVKYGFDFFAQNFQTFSVDQKWNYPVNGS